MANCQQLFAFIELPETQDDAAQEALLESLLRHRINCLFLLPAFKPAAEALEQRGFQVQTWDSLEALEDANWQGAAAILGLTFGQEDAVKSWAQKRGIPALMR